jgi:hypothetical protein
LKDNGKTTICTAKDSTPGRTDAVMTESTKMTRSTVTGSILGKTFPETPITCRADGRKYDGNWKNGK